MKSTKDSKRAREALGQVLRQRREEASLSQEKLGELVDCHRNYVGLIERGQQNITIDMLGRFAAALECTMAHLMAGAEL